jgi:adenosylcobinamide kinase/adenosylcobinamide-phosphate guanylyltransferase
MEHLIMVTGGARSGKSEYAENLYGREDQVCYIATGMVNLSDAEMTDRINKHRARRSKRWTTEERYDNIAKFMDQSVTTQFLLDDATNMITNLFFDWVNEAKGNKFNFDAYINQINQDQIDEATSYILQQWINIIEVNSRRHKTLVIVTNEVGLGIVPATKLTRILRDIYGSVNKLIASKSDEVWFVISGLPQKIK